MGRERWRERGWGERKRAEKGERGRKMGVRERLGGLKKLGEVSKVGGEEGGGAR